MSSDVLRVAGNRGHLGSSQGVFIIMPIIPYALHASRNVAMNDSLAVAPSQPIGAVTAWNESVDDRVYEDYPLGSVRLLRGNGSSGGESTWNETEYDYDYEEALKTFFWSQLAPALVVYAATYLVGVAGNSLIIFTICRFRRLKTTTNVFLASLASADLLLILLCIPVKVRNLYSFFLSQHHFNLSLWFQTR